MSDQAQNLRRPQAAPEATAFDADALLAQLTVLGVTLAPDRLPAVLDGARHLHAAALLLRDALAAPDDPR